MTPCSLLLHATLALAASATPSAPLPLASATPVPADRVSYVTPPGATASVLVKREGGSSVAVPALSVLLEGREVATIEEKEFVSFAVVPGHHVVGIRTARTNVDPTTLSITAGAYGNYYFRISQTSAGEVVFQLSSGADD